MTKASVLNREFYRGKRVLVTGHAGFKGAWMTLVLNTLGAKTCGFALEPEAGSLYTKLGTDSLLSFVKGDVGDRDALVKTVQDFQPEIILHLAAVVTVQGCYENPHRAFWTNVMGTVNILEAAVLCGSVKSVVVVTTDKVYENKGDHAVYKVGDPLSGVDPLAASKSGAELAIEAYKNCYLHKPERTVGVAAVRTSNVIAGGDHVETRLVPSILRGFASGKPVQLRNPEQTRPWQSVLDALNGYLTIGRKLYEDPVCFSRPWNIGPTKDGIKSVGLIYEKLRQNFNSNEPYQLMQSSEIKESQTLGLDIEESQKLLSWEPEQSLDKILFELTDYFKRQQNGENEQNICTEQIEEFFGVRG